LLLAICSLAAFHAASPVNRSPMSLSSLDSLVDHRRARHQAYSLRGSGSRGAAKPKQTLASLPSRTRSARGTPRGPRQAVLKAAKSRVFTSLTLTNRLRG
jgi:hypothetical protein